MATLNKFNAFIPACMAKKHDLGNDTIKAMLTNTAPVATNALKANLTEITAENGYTAGGETITVVTSGDNAGTYELVLTDKTITAAGGTIGPFRYMVLYNDTAANDELISWYDYGSSTTLNDGETFDLDFGATALTI